MFGAKELLVEIFKKKILSDKTFCLLLKSPLQTFRPSEGQDLNITVVTKEIQNPIK